MLELTIGLVGLVVLLGLGFSIVRASSGRD
jgi:hypothetical protein